MLDATTTLLLACTRTGPVLDPARQRVHIESRFRPLGQYPTYCLSAVTLVWTGFLP